MILDLYLGVTSDMTSPVFGHIPHSGICPIGPQTYSHTPTIPLPFPLCVA